MKPVDYRDATWADLQSRVEGLRAEVLASLRAKGPCTTRELAQRSGVDILTVRPRITELVQLGLVDVVDADKPAREGRYYALPEWQARQNFEGQCQAARNPQMQLL